MPMLCRFLISSPALVFCLFLSVSPYSAKAQLPEVQTIYVKRTFNNGEHNAFTDLTRFNGKYYLTFRSCPEGHGVSDKAYVIILSSQDARQWNEVYRFHVKDFVDSVHIYCETRGIPFVRTPAGGVAVSRQRMKETVETGQVFTLLCHPTNLAIKAEHGEDPVETFLFPSTDRLGKLHREGLAWVCICGEMADFYRKTMR